MWWWWFQNLISVWHIYNKHQWILISHDGGVVFLDGVYQSMKYDKNRTEQSTHPYLVLPDKIRDASVPLRWSSHCSATTKFCVFGVTFLGSKVPLKFQILFNMHYLCIGNGNRIEGTRKDCASKRVVNVNVISCVCSGKRTKSTCTFAGSVGTRLSIDWYGHSRIWREISTLLEEQTDARNDWLYVTI